MRSHAARHTAQGMLLSLLLLSSSFAADDLSDRFAERYGERFQRVQQSLDKRDDRDLARQLLEEARDQADQPAWLGHLCEKAYELTGRHAAGHEIAVEAMRLRADHQPDARADALEKIARVHRQQFSSRQGDQKKRAGRDLISARVEAAEAMEEDGQHKRAVESYSRALMVAAAIRADRGERQRIQRRRDAARAVLRRRERIEDLRDRLRSDASDTEAAETIAKLLVINGEPKTAAQYRGFIQNETLSDRLALAAKAPAALKKDEAIKLGAWYRELLSEYRGEPGLTPLLKCTHQAYDRFLHLHEGDDADRRTAERARRELAERLKRLGVQPPPTPIKKLAVNRPRSGDPPAENMRRRLPGQRPGNEQGSNPLFEALRAPENLRQGDGAGPGWTELLPKTQLRGNDRRGGWRNAGAGTVEGRASEGGEPDPLVAPVRILRGSYRLHLRFKVREGDGGMRLIIPAGDRVAELLVETDDAAGGGFQGIDGSAPVETMLNPVKVESGRLQTLSVQVSPGEDDRIRISAGLNGEPFAAWEGHISKLPGAVADVTLPEMAPALVLAPSKDGGRTFGAFEATPLLIELTALNLKLLENGEARMPQ